MTLCIKIPEWIGKPCAPNPDDTMIMETHLDWLTPPVEDIDPWIAELWGDNFIPTSTEKSHLARLSGKLALLVAASTAAENQYERWLRISYRPMPESLHGRAKQWVYHLINIACESENENIDPDALQLHRLEQLKEHPEWVL